MRVNRAHRTKNGSEQSLVVEADGAPLGVVVINGGKIPDMKLREATIDAIVVEPPELDELEPNLCLDRRYGNPTGHNVTDQFAHVGHVRPIGDDRWTKGGVGRRDARHWVVERTLAWLSKCPALLIRYNKHDSKYLRLIKLAWRPVVVRSSPPTQGRETVLRSLLSDSLLEQG